MSVMSPDESLPVVARVDLLVVGGSSGGVACAWAAARAGLTVFLAAPRTYLGEDVAAAFDFWPEAEDDMRSGLARRAFPQGPDPWATPATPMHIKRTLEQTLIEAGVEFVFGSHPAGVLRDAGGRIAGAVIANRNGRQAIKAPRVVDTTERGMLARQRGAHFTPAATGLHRARHVTVGGEPIADDPALSHEPLTPMVAKGKDGPIELPAHCYRFEVDLGGGAWADLEQAYAQAVDRCWRPGVWLHSERLGIQWPDRLAGEPVVCGWQGVDDFPLEAFRVEPGLNLLGPAARVDEHAARGLRRPAHGIRMGERLGAGLAELDATASTEPLHIACANSEHVRPGQVRTAGFGLRPGVTPTGVVNIDPNDLPRVGHFDVVVVGGGTGGAPAAIGAARAGAKTLVCEAGPALGGVGTIGQISSYWFGNIVGFTTEINAGVDRLEADERFRKNQTRWTPPAKKAWYLREMLRLGCDVRFNVTFCAALADEGRVRGVVIAGPHGFGLVEAGAVVDATGNADVAAAAGAPTTGVDAEHVAVQGTGLAGMIPDRPTHNTDHSFSDDTDLIDATAFYVTSREKFAESFDLGQLIDSRERRQIIGEVELGPADMLADRRFPDSICLHSSNFDSHGFTIHPLFMVKAPNKERLWVYVPYHCLIPRGVEGILVTGLGVSAHRDAIPVIRMQADVQNQGYAAGRAAAMAAEQGVDVRAIDIKALQRHLVDIGNLPESTLTDNDSFPVRDAKLRWAVNEGWDDYLGIALCFAEPERTLPILEEAYDVVGDLVRKLRYALILALIGSDHGVETLRDTLADRDWDEGWNFKGMGQFGMCLSDVDTMLIALAGVDDHRAWSIVLEKIAALDQEPDFSHCRAVGEACEKLYDRHPQASAAPALASLLDRPGLTGHAQTTLAEARARLTQDANENRVRNCALRELHLARALYRCGDEQGKAQAILTRYADDLRGHFARHARSILQQNPLTHASSV